MVQIYHGNAFTQRRNPVLRPLKPVDRRVFRGAYPASPAFPPRLFSAYSGVPCPPSRFIIRNIFGAASLQKAPNRDDDQVGEDDAITPPKLMPPFQRTAASGMFPTEHTNEMTAASGPTIGPQK